MKEQWYRYNANLGTFLAHRWIREGADTRRLAELRNGRTTSRNKRPGLALFAAERARELLASGRHSLFQDRITDGVVAARITDVEAKFSARPLAAGIAKFRQLRAEAEQWNSSRAAYIDARIKTGTHSDTDAAFWSGWREPNPPSLELAFQERVIYTLLQPWVWIPILFIAASGSAVALWRRQRRRATARKFVTYKVLPPNSTERTASE